MNATPKVVVNRRLDIDAAKGLAIILVVFGHVVARDIPTSGQWYGVAKHYVYTFHMPLFIFLNGFVYALTWNDKSALRDQIARSWFKASRLIPPFLVMGLLIFLGKMFAAQFTTVDNPVTGFNSLVDLIVRPTASFSSFLWYLYVLSIVFLMFPILYRILSGRIVLLLFVSASLYLLPSSNLFAWDRIKELLFFFVLGVWCSRNSNLFNQYSNKFWWIFGICLVFAWQLGIDAKIICGVLVIPFVIGMINKIPKVVNGFLVWVGGFSLAIYLLNTIFIGISKAIVSRFIAWDGEGFILFFSVLILAGIFIPIVVKKLVFEKIEYLDRYTG